MADKKKEDKKKHYSNVKVTNLPHSEVEIEAEISEEKMTSLWGKAVAKISEKVEVDGFRKGKAPENVVVKKVGEISILEEAGEMAISESYADILVDHSIDAIGQPKVQITKIAKNSPLGFKIVTAVLPKVEIKDYKKEAAEIAKKPDEALATDKDVDQVIENIQANRKQIERSKIEKERKEKKDETPVEDKDITVPEFDDEFVKSLGDFKDVSDFKAKIKENIQKEKEREAKDKKRGELIDMLLTKVKVEVPAIMLEGELEKMMAQFKDDIAKAGVTMEDYLKQLGKSADEIKEEWKPSAEKRVMVQLILSQIAQDEKIKPTEEAIKKEVDHLLSHYKDADRFRARMYIESVLTNEMVLRTLLGESLENISTHDHQH